MTHLFDQFIRAAHFPQKAGRKSLKESRLESYLRAAASRGSIGAWGVPLDSFAAQALLAAERTSDSSSGTSKHQTHKE